MYCRRCGTGLSEDAKFCTNCGLSIAESVAPDKKEDTAVDGVSSNAMPSNPMNSSGSASANSVASSTANAVAQTIGNSSSKNKSKYFLIGAGVVVTIVIIGIIGILLGSNKSTSPRSELSNNRSANSGNTGTSGDADANTPPDPNAGTAAAEAVVDIHDFKNDSYKQYVGKTITITGVPVEYVAGEYTLGTMLVGIQCNNQTDLPLEEGSTINVTGLVSNNTTSDMNIKMTNCRIGK